MKKDITVIIPVYNAEATINKCINSLVNQTGNFSYEILAIDDGSTDNTLQFLKEYKNNDKVKVISKKNTGASDTRNYGIARAISDYITFVDADDYVDSDYLSTLFKQYKVNENCDLAICGYQKEDSDGSLRFKALNQDNNMNQIEALENIFVSTGYEGYPWNKLFKLSIIKDNHIFFRTDLSLAEDLYFCCEYLLYCREVDYNPKVSYHYVVQANSQINSNKFGAPFKKKSLNAIVTYQRLQSLIPNTKRYTKVHQSIDAQLCWSATSILRAIMAAPNKKSVSKEVINDLWNITKKYRHEFMQNDILPKRDKIIYLLNLYAPHILAWLWVRLNLRGNGF